jgi:serine/threonine protein kinase
MIGRTISHYKILEKLGEGGMGVVYKAEDARLRRPVALKFLPADLTRDPEAKKRFVQEAQAASALDHANICTIHEIDETEEGQLFIVMAYYDGKTLRDKLQSESLTIEDATEISAQVAKGLSKAHAKGIFHRDIKPANLLITEDNEVKIIDFGLARLSGKSRLTKTHTTMGTTAYLSPEQARGEEVDHRTDIWSLGVVLYEMLTGELPFEGDYEQAVVYAILNEKPASIHTDIPDYLKQVIGKALEKDQNQRYQLIHELLDDVKSTATSTLTSTPQEKSIVVLPFENMSPDPDQEYFSDGLTEEIISDLSQIRDLLVISRSSAMTFKGTKKKINEIAKEVNVHYVLEGSVRKAGNNLRITAQLIDAANDAHLWADKYKGTLDDVFDIQEKVSRSIVGALSLKLSTEEDQNIAEKTLRNVQAYECYLKARHEIWRFTEESLEHALKLLKEGMDIVGGNELIYSALGLAYFQYVNIGIRIEEKYLDKAEAYAQKAIELEVNSSAALFLMSMIYETRGNVRKALEYSKQAVTAGPNNPDALMGLAFLYSVIGKGSYGKPLVERLMTIDPLSTLSYFGPIWLHLTEGRMDLVVEWSQKMYELDPQNPASRFWYAWALAANNRCEEAYDTFDQVIRGTPETIFAYLSLLFKHALQGHTKDVIKDVHPKLVRLAEIDHLFSWFMAECYALIDDKENALDWLVLAVQKGRIDYPFLNEYDPFLENIRGETRFKKLMERVKYEWENFEA